MNAGCGHEFLWPIIKDKNISVWQTFAWNLPIFSHHHWHKQFLSEAMEAELRPENCPLSPHPHMPFSFSSSSPTEPSAPDATVVSISSETVALPLFWLKEQYCSWRCLSSVFYSYIATIKPILTDSIWQQRQSTKSKPSCQEAVPTATHFYRTHAHEQAQSIQVNIKSHTAPSPLPTPPVFCQPPHILGKPTSSLPTASSPDYDRAQLKSPKAGPIPQKA